MPSLFYLITLGTVATLVVLRWFVLAVAKWIAHRSQVLFCGPLLTTVALRRRKYLGPVTRRQIILFAAYTGALIFCNLYKVSDANEKGKRAANIAVWSIALLLCAPRPNMLSWALHISLALAKLLHRTLAFTAILEMVVHFGYIADQGLIFSQYKQRDGILAGSLLSGFAVVGILRRYFYEMGTKIHLALCVALLIFLWLHLQVVSTEALWYLSGGLIVFGIGLFLSLLNFIWLNFRSFSRGFEMEVLSARGDISILSLRLPRDQAIQPGQFYELCVPKLKWFWFCQLHPLYVAWWYTKADHIEAKFLVQPYSGFTRRGLERKGKMTALLDGPWGKPTDFSNFGTVVLFAEGIGIAPQVAVMKSLVDGYSENGIRTRRLVLLWQMDHEDHQDWVSTWMQEMLGADKTHILNIQLYVAQGTAAPLQEGAKPSQTVHIPHGVSAATQRNKTSVSYGERVHKSYGAWNVEGILEQEMRGFRGSLLVSVAGSDGLRDSVQKLVSARKSANIVVHNSDLHVKDKKKKKKRHEPA